MAEKFVIVPRSGEVDEVIADSAEEAIVYFAGNMDSDMNAYFRAVPEKEYEAQQKKQAKFEKMNIRHTIGDPYYVIKAGATDWYKPTVVTATMNVHDHRKGNRDYITGVQIDDQDDQPIYTMRSDKWVTEEDMKKNVWFWTKEEARAWLKEYKKTDDWKRKAKNPLKKGDKLKSGFEEFTVVSLEFGGLYNNGRIGISQMNDHGYQYSYKNYFPKLYGAWYLVTDNRMNRFMMIGSGTEDDPYKIEWIPTSSGIIQFQRRAEKIETGEENADE